MADQDVDRSEAATPFKLKKARERGQTGRSTDAVSAAVFTAAVIFLAWQGMASATALLAMARSALLQVQNHDLAQAALWVLLTQLASGAAAVVLPFMGLLMATAMAATWLQSGFVLSSEPLKFDPQRISPAAGLQRLLSARTLFEGLRACVKLVVLTLAAWLALKALMPQFLAVASLSPVAFLRLLADDLAALGWKIALALILIAVLDIAFTRREFGRKMRMSRRELKDEFKEREGDPRIRARLRELRNEMRKRSRALSNTRTADVVVTNPTHYAVALRYVHGEMPAPQLVAKGAGQLAAAMREIAWRHRVPIVQNPPLARRLFREMAIDEHVPSDFHAEVARIIVWVFALRERRGAAA
ncbi:EscU/YscU/HrcU family type III secretion system export apparatus switch protein [Ramlibacter sp. XY19]|uniref:EscU/YscU/HrcU family type III secretion system export apparatus switch protein n=1 Tax=Ramlibacter paludis TaxID=2908000 RepID=UPI0023DC6D5B|nr:EscU/YscU/HrcU family type III secretion system export apparatus switch protein [Ramlibacter paludis]MCG2594940.1 EscU/YscU/HrcU family type III secretion system export apparatus switch protein [Ramlibacter paludis]